MEPQITTVIPTYRRPKMLRRAIESVLAQTYPHFQVMVLDNASGDDTPEVVAEFARRDPRVKYHRHFENIGAIANFQYGMDAVDTPYFSFLCDDDFLFPGFYEHAMKCLQFRPEARFFCGQTVVFDPHQGTHYLRPGGDWKKGMYGAGEATTTMARNMFVLTACLLSSEIRQEFGPFPPCEIGDIPFLIKAAAMFPFVVSSLPCAVFSDYPGGIHRLLPPTDLRRSYQATKEYLASTEAIPREEVTFINAMLEWRIQRVISARLRWAFQVGGWEYFDAAADVLRRQGGMRAGDKLRVMLAGRRKRNRLFLRIVRSLLGVKPYLRVLRMRGWRRATVEEVIETYRARESGGIRDAAHGGRSHAGCAPAEVDQERP